ARDRRRIPGRSFDPVGRSRTGRRPIGRTRRARSDGGVVLLAAGRGRRTYGWGTPAGRDLRGGRVLLAGDRSARRRGRRLWRGRAHAARIPVPVPPAPTSARPHSGAQCGAQGGGATGPHDVWPDQG